MWSSAATPLPAPPSSCRRSASAAARYAADWAGRCRRSGAAAEGHPPAGYGSGAAVVEVHPRGSCCSKRPFSSHCRSRRPWRSDFLRSSLTSCLGAGCSWRRRGQRGVLRPVQGGSVWRASESGRLCGARDHSAAVKDSLVLNVTQCEKKQRVCLLIVKPKNERSLRSGMLPVCWCVPACVCECVCVWRRERASDALPRNSAGSMLRSRTVGNLTEALWAGWSAWEEKKWFVGSPVAEIRSVWPKSNNHSDIGEVLIGWKWLEWCFFFSRFIVNRPNTLPLSHFATNEENNHARLAS